MCCRRQRAGLSGEPGLALIRETGLTPPPLFLSISAPIPLALCLPLVIAVLADLPLISTCVGECGSTKTAGRKQSINLNLTEALFTGPVLVLCV